MYRDAYKKITKYLSITLLVLLLFSFSCVPSAAEEKTPAPRYVWGNERGITWMPQGHKTDLKFRIYYKDKWSGESYKLLATVKGFDHYKLSALDVFFRFRDATKEKDPQIKKEKKDGFIYYSIPAISGHKYKVAVKTYDEDYGLWSDKTTAEFYYMSKPEATIKHTKKGFSISWKPVPGATKYYIYRDDYTSNIYGTQCFKGVGSAVTTYEDTSVINGYIYSYDVYAGRGKWENGCCVTDWIRAELSEE